MMATFYSFLVLALSLLSGGGNDLLDYLPSDAYWKAKGVEVSLQTMLAELDVKAGEDVSAAITDLGSPDAELRDKAALRIREAGGAGAVKALAEASDAPDAEVRRRARTLLRQIGGDEVERGVRRLMAVRTLGEMRKPEALPKLKPLMEATEPFVADYAKVAVDLIEGRKPRETRAVPAAVANDVWLLPADCKTVGQLVPRRGAPLDEATFAETMKVDGAADADAKRHNLGEGLTAMLVPLADEFGNFRIDGVSFGITGTLVRPGPRRGAADAAKPAAPVEAGYLALVVRGRYQANWLRTLARSKKIAADDVDGVEVFRPDGETAVIMPADDLLVFIASDDNIDVPAKALAAAIKAGKPVQRPADDATRKLVASIDTANSVLWAASVVSPSQKALPAADAFDTITLVGSRQGKALDLKMAARGSDAAQVTKAVEAAAKHAKDSAEFLEGMQVVSSIRMSVQLLKSVQASAEGTNATLTAKLDATPAAVLSLPFLTDEEGPAPEETPTNPRLRK